MNGEYKQAQDAIDRCLDKLEEISIGLSYEKHLRIRLEKI